MDAHEFRDLLEAIDRAQAALRMIGPGRRPSEVQRTVTEARSHLNRMRGMLDTVHRREFLHQVGVLGVAPLLPSFSVRDALTRPVEFDTTLPSLSAVRCGVEQLWEARQSSHYEYLGFLLPRVLVASQATARDRGPNASALLAMAYQGVTGAMAKIGKPDLAWIAAEHGIVAAKESGSATVIAASERMLAHAFLSMDHNSKAQQVALDAAGTLRLAKPHDISVYGALMNTCAIAVARQHDRKSAQEFLDEAGTAADRLGEDRNHMYTAFGPTNVGIHRVSVAVQLGDGGRAVEEARRVDPSQLPLERRAHLLIDVAQGYEQCRGEAQAVDTLLEAEELAPEEVRYQPAVHLLIASLLRRKPNRNLLALAARMGVGG